MTYRVKVGNLASALAHTRWGMLQPPRIGVPTNVPRARALAARFAAHTTLRRHAAGPVTVRSHVRAGHVVKGYTRA